MNQNFERSLSMDLSKTHIRREKRRRASARRKSSPPPTHGCPHPPHPYGPPEVLHPQQRRLRQSEDHAAPSRGSEYRCLNESGCDCPECRENYGSHSRNRTAPESMTRGRRVTNVPVVTFPRPHRIETNTFLIRRREMPGIPNPTTRCQPQMTG